MTLWFVPVRVHCNQRTFLIEAGSLGEAVKELETNELYYKNHNNLSKEEREKVYNKYPKFYGMLELFEFEEEFFADKSISFGKQSRFGEKVLKCNHRYYNNEFKEYHCKKFNPKEVSRNNRFCIIHDPHYEFDLPKDCPYLKKESIYVNFFDLED